MTLEPWFSRIGKVAEPIYNIIIAGLYVLDEDESVEYVERFRIKNRGEIKEGI